MEAWSHPAPKLCSLSPYHPARLLTQQSQGFPTHVITNPIRLLRRGSAMSGLPLHTPLRPQESLGSQGVDSSPNFRRQPDDAHALCAHMYMHTRTYTQSKGAPTLLLGGWVLTAGTPATPDCFQFLEDTPFPSQETHPLRSRVLQLFSRPTLWFSVRSPSCWRTTIMLHSGAAHCALVTSRHTAGGPALASEHENTTDPCVSRYGKAATSQGHSQVPSSRPLSFCALPIHPASKHPLTQVKIHPKYMWLMDKIHQR